MSTIRQDSTLLQYQKEIDRLTRRFESLRRRLKTAKTEATRKKLRRAIYTVKVGRGQLRRVVEYLQSHGRLVTVSSRMLTESGRHLPALRSGLKGDRLR